MKLKNYLNDGANWQAQSVLAYLRHFEEIIIDDSWDKEKEYYKAKIEVGRLENCREQGYIFSLRYGIKQMNYAVYEHRNSDCICVDAFELYTINTPTLEDLCSFVKDKWDHTKSFSFGQIMECGDWIWHEMEDFIKKCNADGSAFPKQKRKCDENKS